MFWTTRCDDPFRPDLRNLFLERNDSLLNNFESHLLLMNLGNIDWRALLNLWSVLEYLTKYTAKGGQASRHLGRVFEEVLGEIFQWDLEDGVRDMWRRTIMKFYSRILGDRDYTLSSRCSTSACGCRARCPASATWSAPPCRTGRP